MLGKQADLITEREKKKRISERHATEEDKKSKDNENKLHFYLWLALFTFHSVWENKLWRCYYFMRYNEYSVTHHIICYLLLLNMANSAITEFSQFTH